MHEQHCHIARIRICIQGAVLNQSGGVRYAFPPAGSGDACCEGVSDRRLAWRRMATSGSVLIRHALVFLDHTPQYADQVDQSNDTAAAIPLKPALHTGVSAASFGRPKV